MYARRAPAYLRLGRDEKPKDLTLPPYAPWRQVLAGEGSAMVLVIVGPLAGGIIAPLRSWAVEARPSVWVVSELPIDAAAVPEAFLADVRRAPALVVVEEHVAHGGAGQMLASALLARGASPARFIHRCAVGYPSGTYGSQQHHRRESGLDPDSIAALLRSPLS
jgi:transketolase